MVDMLGDPERQFNPAAKLPPSFARALAADVAGDSAVITPPHPTNPKRFEYRAAIALGNTTQVFYFERVRGQEHRGAWKPCRPPTDEQSTRVRALLKVGELKELEESQGYKLLALHCEG